MAKQPIKKNVNKSSSDIYNFDEKTEKALDIEYALDVGVDPDQLHWEWGRLPSLIMKYGKIWANFNRLKQKKEEELGNLKADWRKKVLSNPKTYGLSIETKPTTKDIDSVIDTQSRVKELSQEIINLTYRVNMLSNARKALDHKKKALEWLSRLYLVGYFSEKTKVPKQVRDAMLGESFQMEHKNLNMNERMTKRTKEFKNGKGKNESRKRKSK